MTDHELTIKEAYGFARSMNSFMRSMQNAEEVLARANSVANAQDEQRKVHNVICQDVDLGKADLIRLKDETVQAEELHRTTMEGIAAEKSAAHRDLADAKAQVAAERQTMLDEVGAKRDALLAEQAKEAADHGSAMELAEADLDEVMAKQRAAEAAIANMRGQVEGLSA